MKVVEKNKLSTENFINAIIKIEHELKSTVNKLKIKLGEEVLSNE